MNKVVKLRLVPPCAERMFVADSQSAFMQSQFTVLLLLVLDSSSQLLFFVDLELGVLTGPS